MQRVQNGKPRRWQKVVAGLLFALLVYEFAYRHMVSAEPYGATGPAYQDSTTTVPVVSVEPRYFESRVPQAIASAFFAPANWVDRRLRPRMWDAELAQPTVRFQA